MHPDPSDPFLGQITLHEDEVFHPNQHTELHNCDGMPDLPHISIDSYSTGLLNYITFLPSPNANAFGTSDTLGNFAAPMQGAGQKRTFLLDDAQPEQNRASKHRKVLTGNKLPTAHTQPLVSHTFRVTHDQSGRATVTTASQGYGMSIAPIHRLSLQSTGVAGLSFTRPAMPQVILSASNDSGVSPDIPPHSNSVSKVDNLGPTMYSVAQMKD